MRVCVIGLGEVGLATAKYVLGKGLDLWGYDISPAAVRNAKNTGISNVTTIWEQVPPADVYLICVYTGLKKGGKADLSAVYDACEKIKSVITSSAKPLISVESTVVPGLCRQVFREIFEENVLLVHVPHRYWGEDPEKHGVKQKRVIGGVNDKSLEAGTEFYMNVLEVPLHVVSPIEVAEMSKIVENAYRYVQIAFAEELRMICEEFGLDFEEVRRACNTKWNIKILEAREGIGGHCLPKDIRYLASLTRVNTLLKSSMIVDKQYRKWLKKHHM